MEFLIREYEDHYNSARPHQGIENCTISAIPIPSPDTGPPAPNEVECQARLGGLLRHYYRKAA